MYSLESMGFKILDQGPKSVRVGGVTAYGDDISALSVIIYGRDYETLTLGPGENGKLKIVYTNDPPYNGDVMRFPTFAELVRHLRYATGRGATTGRRTTTVVEDESSEEEEVETAEIGETAAAPPPPPEVVVETAETGETAAAPPPPPADTGTPVPPLPPAVSGTPVPPIPPEMGIMELGAQLVELFQDKGPMMTESETKALGALMELMKTLGA